jgi:tRNA 2-thiouridine synthesizing protein A
MNELPQSTALDLRGLKCPLPALRTRRALRRVPPGQVLIVTCTDPLSVVDIPHLVQETGDRLEHQNEKDGFYEFQIRRVAPAAEDRP